MRPPGVTCAPPELCPALRYSAQTLERVECERGVVGVRPTILVGKCVHWCAAFASHWTRSATVSFQTWRRSSTRARRTVPANSPKDDVNAARAAWLPEKIDMAPCIAWALGVSPRARERGVPEKAMVKSCVGSMTASVSAEAVRTVRRVGGGGGSSKCSEGEAARHLPNGLQCSLLKR